MQFWRSVAPDRDDRVRGGCAGPVPHDVQVRPDAPAGEHVMTNKKLPALVQGRLIATLDLDGAGSNDRGIYVGGC